MVARTTKRLQYLSTQLERTSPIESRRHGLGMFGYVWVHGRWCSEAVGWNYYFSCTCRALHDILSDSQSFTLPAHCSQVLVLQGIVEEALDAKTLVCTSLSLHGSTHVDNKYITRSDPGTHLMWCTVHKVMPPFQNVKPLAVEEASFSQRSPMCRAFLVSPTLMLIDNWCQTCRTTLYCLPHIAQAHGGKLVRDLDDLVERCRKSRNV